MLKRNIQLLLGVIVQTTSKLVIPLYCFAKEHAEIRLKIDSNSITGTGMITY